MLRKLILLITTILLLTFATLVQAQQYNNWRLAQDIECDSTTYNYIDTFYYHPNSFTQVDSLKRRSYSPYSDHTSTYHCLYTEFPTPTSTRYQYDFMDSTGALFASNSITKDNQGRPIDKVLTYFKNNIITDHYTMCYSNSIQPDTLIYTDSWNGYHDTYIYVNTYDELSRKQRQDRYCQSDTGWSLYGYYEYSYINPFPQQLDLISHDPFMGVETLFDSICQIDSIVYHPSNSTPYTTDWTCTQNGNICFVSGWLDSPWCDTLRVTYNQYGLQTDYYEHWHQEGDNETVVKHFIWEQVETGNEDSHVVEVLNLSAFPNPFRTSTLLTFELEKAGLTHLSVYNLKGQRVRTLQSGLLAKGMHTLTWNGKDENGRSVASGIYLFQLNTGNHTTVSKAILLK